MKIVLPVHHFPPRYSAGAELYTYRLARWLQDHGHTVEVVCIEALDQGGPGELSVEEDQYDGLTVWRLSFDIWHGDDWRLHSYDNPLLRSWFEQYLVDLQPDLVHFQAGYLIGVAPLQVALAARIPTVLTLHDYWYLCPRMTLLRGDGSLCLSIPEDPSGCAWCRCLESRRYRMMDRLTNGLAGQFVERFTIGDQRADIDRRRETLLPSLAMPDVVIAPSRFLAEQFAPYVDPRRMHISRYGLDLRPFMSQSHLSHDDVLRIGYIGQIARHKGVHLLVEAFRQLQLGERKVELHIHGGLEAQPAYCTRLQQLAGNHTNIHFHGRFENQQAPEILARLDVTVVPSIWYENSPLAIMEAHAAGIPVITAALGGMAELVNDGVDGLHFEAGHAADLSRQLQRIIDDPSLLRQLRNGVKMPRSIEEEMVQMYDVYCSVVEARNNAVEPSHNTQREGVRSSLDQILLA